MAEGFINLFAQQDTTGNKPHFRVLFKLDGVDHEGAVWPAKDGKKGFSGRFKPKQARTDSAPADDAVEDEGMMS
ncbi:MAG: hypothetical protein SGI88_03640 [Candidatus Hydrogenedentes bacterium]|nr:hypothetical protein [Candidatus Hydrogenedentota bacterium]